MDPRAAVAAGFEENTAFGRPRDQAVVLVDGTHALRRRLRRRKKAEHRFGRRWDLRLRRAMFLAQRLDRGGAQQLRP